MRERPILFNGAMVRAILAGQKTQTRRAVKGIALDWLGKAQFTPEYVANPGNDLCPFGHPGDRLWVRETWRPETIHSCAMDNCDCDSVGVSYAADGEWIPHTWQNPPPDDWYMPEAAARGNVPSIHMPRWACRLVLEIIAVRIERLQDISEADAIAEGADENVLPDIRLPRIHPRAGLPMAYADCREVFADLWDTTGGHWDRNTWVWVIEFNKINEVSNG